jgi:hypothetical protein
MTEFMVKSTSQASRDKSIPRTLQRAASKEGNRSRSAHGCWTCRLRRKKYVMLDIVYTSSNRPYRCDENGPECVTCTDRGLKCSGFGAIKPRWMDGGEQQDAVHKDIKATVASVTRMKRMLKLVQAREKASPGRRSASIPVDAFDNANKNFYRQGSFSSGIPSRPASVEPTFSQNLPFSDSQVWASEIPSEWNFDNTFNADPFETLNTFPNFTPECFNFALEDVNSQLPTMSNTSLYLPSQADEVQFYQYSTPEPESYTAAVSGSELPKYKMRPQSCAFPPSPALSISGLERPDPRIRQATPSRMQEVFSHDNHLNDFSHSKQRDGTSDRASISSGQTQLSPVCENSSSRSTNLIVSKYPLLLPKAECPQPSNQVNIQSLEQSASQQATWMRSSLAENRAQLLRAASIELTMLKSLLVHNVDQNLKQAVACVLKVRDEYLTEFESPSTRILSDQELGVLGASIRFVIWTDITSRTFEGAEIESPFRGHISRLLEVNSSSQIQSLGPAGPLEDWIFTGIESVTRLAQMRAQLASEGLFNYTEFHHHEASVLRNLEYRLSADDHSSHDKLPNNKTKLRRSIFLHAIMIYFYVVVQGPYSEAFDIRKNVDLVIQDLIALNDPHALMTEFTWPFLVAASMAGPEHHVALMGMFSSPLASPTPRFTNIFQVVQECWLSRAQGAPALGWRTARMNLVQRGYYLDAACW